MVGARSANGARVVLPGQARHRWPALLALAVAWCAAGEARAARVVVFPLDARGVDASLTQEGTRTVLARLRRVRGLEVVDPETGQAELGVNLTKQARACEYDVFCLVEVGELLQAEQVLIGHLSRPLPTDPKADEGLEFKLIVLDVARAAITEVLLWRVPDLDPSALQEAARAAVSRLFAPKDAELMVELSPPDAELRIYGEQVNLPEAGTAMPYWSGVYHAVVSAPGYLSERLRIPVMRGDEPARVSVSLEPDPLYVAEAKGPVKVFDKDSRRIGSGASAGTVGAVEVPPPAPRYAFQSVPPWLVAGAGVGLSALGAALMQSAQASYNTRAEERRFVAGETYGADVAIRVRDDSRLRYRAGSGTLIGGIGLVVGAGLWMVVDALLTEPARVGEVRPAGQPGRAALDPAALAAARRMSLEAR